MLAGANRTASAQAQAHGPEKAPLLIWTAVSLRRQLAGKHRDPNLFKAATPNLVRGRAAPRQRLKPASAM